MESTKNQNENQNIFSIQLFIDIYGEPNDVVMLEKMFKDWNEERKFFDFSKVDSQSSKNRVSLTGIFIDIKNRNEIVSKCKELSRMFNCSVELLSRIEKENIERNDFIFKGNQIFSGTVEFEKHDYSELVKKLNNKDENLYEQIKSAFKEAGVEDELVKLDENNYGYHNSFYNSFPRITSNEDFEYYSKKYDYLNKKERQTKNVVSKPATLNERRAVLESKKLSPSASIELHTKKVAEKKSAGTKSKKQTHRTKRER